MVGPDFDHNVHDSIAASWNIIRESALKNGHDDLSNALVNPTQSREELAKEILGSDFLGTESIKNVFAHLNMSRLSVGLLSTPPIPFSPTDLEQASKNEEMLVFRPQKIMFSGQEKNVNLPLLLRMLQYNVQGKFIDLENSNLWLADLTQHDTSINGGWALVRKNPLPTTSNIAWNSQNSYIDIYQEVLMYATGIQSHVERRNITDALWDTAIYTATKREPILQGLSDWTSTRVSLDSNAEPHYLEIAGPNQEFAHKLAIIRPINPFTPDPTRGVCTSRFIA